MSNPLISVIIPTYNNAEIIKETIESALNQTFKDFEIIVINDGSTDNSADVLRPYINSGKIIYLEQDNSGPTMARNRGIETSRGKYIAFLDNDDLWMPTKLEKQVDFLNRNEDYGMAYTDAYEFRGSKILKSSKLTSNDISMMTGMIFEHLMNGCFIFMSTVVVRKSVLEDMGYFDPNVGFTCNDWELWLRISKKYKIKFIDEILIGYRRHSGNITNDTDLLTSHLLSFVNNVLTDPSLEARYKERRSFMIGKIYSRAGWDYLMAGKRKKARSAFLNYIKLNPSKVFGYKLMMKSFLAI